MMQIPLLIRVFSVPGGERDSSQVFQELALLLERHPDLSLSVFHGRNRVDGRWIITLIGEPASYARYQEQIEHSLLRVQAAHISVSAEGLAPLVKRSLERQVQMGALQKTSFQRHSPLRKTYATNKKSFRLKKRRKG